MLLSESGLFFGSLFDFFSLNLLHKQLVVVVVSEALRLLPRPALLHLDIESVLNIFLHSFKILALFFLFELLLKGLSLLNLPDLFVHFLVI